jgi:tRNA (adenine22-N1)-methyltransferase
MKEKTEPFIKKWTQEIEHFRRILTSIESAAVNPGNEAKKRELHDLIAMLEEVIRK